MMQVSEKGRAFIANHEGVVLKAYRCPAGVLTIGVGHTSNAGAPKVFAGMTITRDDAMDILSRDLRTFEKRTEARMGAIPQNVFDGSTSFDFNTGRIHNATWVRVFLQGMIEAAERSFKSWNKGGGKILKGLVRRRAEEWGLISTGKAPGGKAASEAAASSTIAEIASYQEALKTLGFYTGDIDGDRGPLTIGAVENFQRKHGLEVDSVVGPATRAILQRELERKTGNQHSAAGGATGATGTATIEAGDQVVNAPSIDPVAVASDMNLWLILIVAIAFAGAVWGAWWLWRNRGRFTGKRVAT